MINSAAAMLAMTSGARMSHCPGSLFSRVTQKQPTPSQPSPCCWRCWMRRGLAPTRLSAGALPTLSGKAERAVWVFCRLRVFLHLAGRASAVRIALFCAGPNFCAFLPVTNALAARRYLNSRLSFSWSRHSSLRFLRAVCSKSRPRSIIVDFGAKHRKAPL